MDSPQDLARAAVSKVAAKSRFEALPAGDRFDLGQCFGVLERRKVAGICAKRLRAHCPPDDLRAAGLGQRGHEQDPLRRESLPELRSDEVAQLRNELLG